MNRSRVEACRRPAINDRLGQLSKGLFGFIVAVPPLVGVVESEGGNHHRTLLGRNQGDIVADGVEGADFVADSGTVLAGVEKLKIARQAVAVLLIAQHVQQRAAERAITGQRWRVIEGKAALGQSIYDGSHL